MLLVRQGVEGVGDLVLNVAGSATVTRLVEAAIDAEATTVGTPEWKKVSSSCWTVVLAASLPCPMRMRMWS